MMLLIVAALQLTPATPAPQLAPCTPVTKGEKAPPHCTKMGTAELTVGTDGRVKRCKIKKTTGNASLDKRICSILKAKARFKPALDRNGNPVEDTVTTPPITWHLQDDPPITAPPKVRE